MVARVLCGLGINTPLQDLIQGLMVEILWGIWLVGVNWVDRLVMVCRVVLSDIIPKHKSSWQPCCIDDLVILGVTGPKVAHIESTGLLLFNVAADDGCCCGVVAIDGCRSMLTVAKVFKDGAKSVCFLCIEEQGSEFCFSSRSGYKF